MKCEVCLRRNGVPAHIDEDAIGCLCPRCHFDLVMLVRLLVTGARVLRQMDRQIVGRIVKALLSLGSPLVFVLLLVSGCPEALVVRFSSTYQNATPAPWVSSSRAVA